MKLAIMERIIVLGVLPKEGSIDTLKALRKFKESLSLSEEEKTKINWRLEYKCPKCGEALYLPVPTKCATCNVWLESTGAGQWNAADDPNKDVFVPATINGIIVSTLTKMNEKNKLTEELIPIYDKFVGQEDK